MLVLPHTGKQENMRASMSDVALVQPIPMREQLLEAPKTPPASKLPKILEDISWCESRGRQFDGEGNVIRGGNPDDIGKYQINLRAWGEEAKKLHYDLYTESGNEAMALEIYQRYGVEPWTPSRPCWEK